MISGVWSGWKVMPQIFQMLQQISAVSIDQASVSGARADQAGNAYEKLQIKIFARCFILMAFHPDGVEEIVVWVIQSQKAHGSPSKGAFHQQLMRQETCLMELYQCHTIETD
eukprot:1134558-Pelagomonas_calceolata.AAC.6